MIEKIFIRSKDVSNNTLSNIDSRDIAIWIHDLPADANQRALLTKFLQLPWRLVMYDGQDINLLSELETKTSNDPLIYKRGFVQIIDSDPSRIELPSRCLPIFLLNGRQTNANVSSFENRLRRMTMLEEFRRSEIRELLLISGRDFAMLSDLGELWAAGYRTQLTFVADSPSAESKLENWIEVNDVSFATIIQQPWQRVVEDILTRYWQTFPIDRHIVRMRDTRGQIHKIDITEADEIERPILEYYELIEERNLSSLVPLELSQDEFIGFFKNPHHSWRPYAAGLPWERDKASRDKLRKYLRRLDIVGPDENCVTYIASEPGAGGTTLARTLGWGFAREGYPVIVAKPYPFVPDALPLVNYLTRVHRMFAEQTTHQSSRSDKSEISTERYYETPWIIVFDTLHWQNRDTELLQFRNELARSGRSVCILVVTSSSLGLTFLNTAIFKKISELNHSISLSEARELGNHLNEFLKYYGKERTEGQWDRFYDEHHIRDADGLAAFWVTLSFWIQGQYDMTESIQQWIYKAFQEQADDQTIQDAILQIAAMSSERLPYPQTLLPRPSGRWPVWLLFEDRAASLARLGLMQFVAQGERHWALVHDILGRLLINALYYDYSTREKLGFSIANDPDHLRFLVFSKISNNSRLGEKDYITIGEDFATEIFKIDPDRGKNSFTLIWRDVLSALDNMPVLLRNTSRVFRHHSAISRRRIAKLGPEHYDLNNSDKIALLERAIEDIKYALVEIPYTSGSEPNLNLLNSLAHAYFDLAEIEEQAGASYDKILELRKLADEATQRAFLENPNNSFVLETYVRSLLQSAQHTPEQAVVNCVSALGVIYSALQTGIDNARTPQLGRLADRALEILFQQAPGDTLARHPQNAIDVLVQAWLIMAGDSSQNQDWILEEVPLHRQEEALKILTHRAGQGNLQILRLQYDLLCNCRPFEYKAQIELLEPIQLSNYVMSSQLRLEYAILLFQTGRPKEGDKAFQTLRQMWQASEQFVQVPNRLRWLRSVDGKNPKIVQATVGSGYGTRIFAIVRDLANVQVPFRPEEHGLREAKPGAKFSCHVSFGHNGPFLRPLTAHIPSVE